MEQTDDALHVTHQPASYTLAAAGAFPGSFEHFAAETTGTMDTAEAVLKFLRSVGPRTEAEFYLQQFRQTPRESFAAVVVDGPTMAENADAVAVDLRFLTLLELTPIVVLGLLDGDDAKAQVAALEELLTAQEVRVTGPLASDAIEAITNAARVGTIPLVIAAGANQEARTASLGALLTSLRTHKLIFLRQGGGMRLQGERLSLIDLGAEAETLLRASGLTPLDRTLLSMARQLVLNLVQGKLLIAVTAPFDLLHELFTVRGAGTLLRRAATIRREQGILDEDREALRNILEASFGRVPDPRVFERKYAHCYLDSAYRGAALVVASPFGGYLSKFAVTRAAQGEGLGRDLWAAVCADYQRLLWRARAGNPIAGWYQQQCQGLYRTGEWTLYTRGIEPEQLPLALAFAQAQPVDFGGDPTG